MSVSESTSRRLGTCCRPSDVPVDDARATGAVVEVQEAQVMRGSDAPQPVCANACRVARLAEGLVEVDVGFVVDEPFSRAVMSLPTTNAPR
jgi:hypothetical protein